MDEGYNLLSEDRKLLLGQLQEAVGDVLPYFLAPCQICNLQAL